MLVTRQYPRLDELPAKIRKDDLKADKDPEFSLGEREIDDLLSGLEIADSLSQGPQLQDFPERDVLSKRDKMNFVISPHDLPGRSGEIGAIVMANPFFFDLVGRASEKKISIGSGGYAKDEGFIFLRVLKEKWSGCLRPDDEVRFLFGRLKRESRVDLQGFFLKRCVPLDRLVDIPLDDPYSQGLLLPGLLIDRPYLRIPVDQDAREDDRGNQDLPVGKSLLGPLVKDQIEDGVYEEDDEREAIDSGDVRNLYERKIEVL